MTTPATPDELARLPRGHQYREEAIILVAVLCGVAFFALVYAAVDSTSAVAEGDVADTVAALFSALAFAAFFLALRLQRADLKLNREEMSLTRAEVAAQREEMEQQNATLRQQRFEGSFFQLLRFLREAVLTTSIEWKTVQASGRAAFRNAGEEIRGLLHVGPAVRLTRAELEDLAREVHDRVLSPSTSDFISYLEALTRLLEFVEAQAGSQRDFCAGLIRAQLTNDERYVIFLHRITPGTSGQFVRLVDDFGLLVGGWELSQPLMRFTLLIHPAFPSTEIITDR